MLKIMTLRGWIIRAFAGMLMVGVASLVGSGTDIMTAGATAYGWSSPQKIDSAAGGYLSSVSCPSSSFCVAVDLLGNAFTYNGRAWSSPDSIDPGGGGALTSVSCPTSSFCVAVDDLGRALTYNGSGWSSPQDVGLGHWLTSVSCPFSSFCMAVAQTGDAYTFNGSTWSTPAYIDSNGELTSVSCPPSSSVESCTAVDNAGNSLIFNGTTTSGAAVDLNGNGLTLVTCPSAILCFAMDMNGNVVTKNADTWSSPQNIDPAGANFGTLYLVSATCPTSSFCIAVDSGGRALTYNGSTWSSPVMIVPQYQGLSSVSCSSATFCAAVNDQGYAFTYGLATSRPRAPLSVHAVAGNDSATVSWLESPSNVGGENVTFVVSSKPANRTCTTKLTHCKVGALHNGVRYTFSVVARNSIGSSSRSRSSNVVVPRIVKAPVTKGSIRVTDLKTNCTASAAPLPGYVNCTGTVTLFITENIPGGVVSVYFNYPTTDGGSFYEGQASVSGPGSVTVPVSNSYAPGCSPASVATMVRVFDGPSTNPAAPLLASIPVTITSAGC